MMNNQNSIPKENSRLPILVIFVTFLIFFLWLSPTRADNLVTSGTTIKINSGTFVTAAQNMVVESGGGLVIDGSLILKNNFTNQNTVEDLGTGTIEFSGSSPQSLSGQNAIGRLVVNNSTGLDINGNTTLNTELVLQNGHIRLGTNNLTLGSTATVIGTPSASAMVVATGTGELRKSFSGTGSFTFPVGDNTETAEYSPVTLNFTSGTFAAIAYAGVNLVNAFYSDPSITGSYLNRYWNITQTGITNFVCDAVYQYQVADVIGTETNITSLRVIPIPITAFSPANLTAHQLTTSGLTSLGTFTGGPGNYSLNLKVFLEGSYDGTTAMKTILKTKNLIPLTRPYTNVAPWNYTGTESVLSIPAGVVDWVFVEVRQAATAAEATSATILSKRAGFLLSNGSIVDLDGVSPLNIGRPTIASNLFVVVRHLNHLAIMSNTSPSASSTAYNYDFTSGLTQAYGGGSGYKQVGSTFAMVVGDIDQDGSIFVSDYNRWAVDFGKTNSYLNADLDMDGDVFVSDYNKWAVNFGLTISTGLKSALYRSKYFSNVPE